MVRFATTRLQFDRSLWDEEPVKLGNYTVETGDDSILGIAREYEGEKIIGLFNFSSEVKTAKLQEEECYKDLMTDNGIDAASVELAESGFVWMKRG